MLSDVSTFGIAVGGGVVVVVGLAFRPGSGLNRTARRKICLFASLLVAFAAAMVIWFGLAGYIGLLGFLVILVPVLAWIAHRRGARLVWRTRKD